MNKTLVLNTVQRLLSRPLSLIVLVGYGFFVLISVFAGSVSSASDNLSSSTAAWFLTWALGSGLLGSDRSQGYLPLLLSRPISRAQYALSRWAGLLVCVLAVDLGLHILVALFYASNHMGIEILPLLERWLWFAYFAALTAAWITLLSALFSSHGDLLYFFAASVALIFAAMKFGGEEAYERVSAGLGFLWKPGEATLKLWQASDSAGAAYTALIFIAGAGLCLALAAYVMQCRDISYVNR